MVPIGAAHVRGGLEAAAAGGAVRVVEEFAAQVGGEMGTGHPGGLAAGQAREGAGEGGGDAAGGAAGAAVHQGHPAPEGGTSPQGEIGATGHKGPGGATRTAKAPGMPGVPRMPGAPEVPGEPWERGAAHGAPTALFVITEALLFCHRVGQGEVVLVVGGRRVFGPREAVDTGDFPPGVPQIPVIGQDGGGQGLGLITFVVAEGGGGQAGFLGGRGIHMADGHAGQGEGEGRQFQEVDDRLGVPAETAEGHHPQAQGAGGGHQGAQGNAPIHGAHRIAFQAFVDQLFFPRHFHPDPGFVEVHEHHDEDRGRGDPGLAPGDFRHTGPFFRGPHHHQGNLLAVHGGGGPVGGFHNGIQAQVTDGGGGKIPVAAVAVEQFHRCIHVVCSPD